MTIEITPVGVKCNLSCSYCYQNPMREAGNFNVPLDFKGMLKTLKGVNQDFAVFGGEAFLTPLDQLEEIWRHGYEKFGKNGVQTNGLILTEKHLQLIKDYNVHVGVSIDGPPICNTPRCGISDTQKIEANIKRLLSERIGTSLIITMHKVNATHIVDLLEWLDDMRACGMKDFNFHNLETGYDSGDLVLSDAANFLVFKTLYDDFGDVSRVSPFRDMISLLTSETPQANCVWNACDPLTTPAVHGISADGSLSNCGRTNKEGIDWRKARGHSSLERYEALYATPFESGGCKDCKYFYACKGQCPGTAIDGDWRNRTRDCQFWYELFTYIENDLVTRGKKVISNERKKELADSLITRNNQEHGDIPHGDSHGDHWDGPKVEGQANVGLY